MKPPNGPRRLTYSQPGVKADVVLDDTGLNGPMGRMIYVAGPPDVYIRPAPPMPEIEIRFVTATNGYALVGGETLPFTHAPL